VQQWRVGESGAGGDPRIGRNRYRIGAGAFRHLGDLTGFFQGDAAGRVQFVSVQPQPDTKGIANAPAGFGQHLAQQSRAILQAAAIFVVAVVVIGREEPGNDVVVRSVNFHTVEAGLLGAYGRGGEPFNHLRDVAAVHYANARAGADAPRGADEIGYFLWGQGVHDVALDRCRHGRHPELAAFGYVTYRYLAGVLQLHGDLRAVLVDPFGQLRETRDEVVTRNADLPGLGGAGRVGHCTHTHDQEGGTAGGTSLVISLDALATVAGLLGEIRAHRCHDDAVAQLKVAQPAGGEQVRIAGHCECPSPWRRFSLPGGIRGTGD
jgi:hypothetical protein